MSQNLLEHTFRPKLYIKEMRETFNKYKLSVHFSKPKLSCYHFATIYYPNVFIFLQIYPHLLKFTYTVNLKRPTHKKFTPKLQKITRVLLVMLLTLIMSVYVHTFVGHLVLYAPMYVWQTALFGF